MSEFYQADTRDYFGGDYSKMNPYEQAARPLDSPETKLTLKPGLKVFAIVLIVFAAAWVGLSTYKQSIKTVRGAATIPPLLAIQLAYEDKLSSMQNALDRLNNRLASRAQGFSTELAKLQSRQARFAQRQHQLENLLQKTFGKSASAQSYLPAPNHIAGIGQSPHQISTKDVMRQMTALQAQQGKLIASMTARTQNRVAKLSGILHKLAAKVSTKNKKRPVHQTLDIGGPFHPLGSLSGLDLALGKIENNTRKIRLLTRSIIDMPVGHPIGPSAAITSGFGVRNDPLRKTRALHSGVDIKGKLGTPVLATANGRVIKAGRYAAYGRMVEIRHKGGITTRYAHLSRIGVKLGDRVKAHDLIGRVGSTGRSTGPHLHYETRVYGKAIDPTRFLQAGRHVYEGKAQTSALP